MVTLIIYNKILDNNYNEIKQKVYNRTFANYDEAEDFYYANVGKHKDWKEYEIRS